MIRGTLLSAVVPGTTLTVIITLWYWYQSWNVIYITGQIGARQRVFILVAPRGSKYFVDQSIDASNLPPPRGQTHRIFEAVLYIQWPCPTRSRLVVSWSYVELEGPPSHVLWCCVLCFSVITIRRTRRDATYNTMITLIKNYVSNSSSRATSRNPDDGSTSYLRGRPIGLVVGWLYVEVEGPSSHVLCCCVLRFSKITILRTRWDAT